MGRLDELEKQGKVRRSPYASGNDAYKQATNPGWNDLPKSLGNAGEGLMRAGGDIANFVGEAAVNIGQNAAESWNKMQQGASKFGEELKYSQSDAGFQESINDPLRAPARILGAASDTIGGVFGTLFSPVTGTVETAFNRAAPEPVKQALASGVQTAQQGATGLIKSATKAIGLSDEFSDELTKSLGSTANLLMDVAPIPGERLIGNLSKTVAKKAASVLNDLNISTSGKFTDALAKYSGMAPDNFKEYGFIDYMNHINNNESAARMRATEGLTSASKVGVRDLGTFAASRYADDLLSNPISKDIGGAMYSLVDDLQKTRYGLDRHDPVATRDLLSQYNTKNVFKTDVGAIKTYSDGFEKALGYMENVTDSPGSLKKAFTSFSKEVGEAKDQFINALVKTSGRDLPGVFDRTRDAISGALINADKPARIGKFSQIVDRVANTIGANGTMAEQQGLISQITDAISNPDASIKANVEYLRTLKDSIQADLEDGLSAISTPAANMFAQTKSVYADMRAAITDAINQGFNRPDADTARIIDDILPDDPDTIHEVMKGLDPSTRATVRQTAQSTVDTTTRPTIKTKMEKVIGDVSGARFSKIGERLGDFGRDIQASFIRDPEALVARAASGDADALDLMERAIGAKKTKSLRQIAMNTDLDEARLYAKINALKKANQGVSIPVNPPEKVLGEYVQGIQKDLTEIQQNMSKAKERTLAMNKDNVIDTDVVRANLEGSLSKFNVSPDGDISKFRGRTDAKQKSQVKTMVAEYQNLISKDTITLADLTDMEGILSDGLDALAREKITKGAPAFALLADMKSRVQGMIDDDIGIQFVTQGGRSIGSYKQVNMELEDITTSINKLKKEAGITTREQEVRSNRAKAADEAAVMNDEAVKLGQYVYRVKSSTNANVMKDMNTIMRVAKKYGVISDETQYVRLVEHLKFMDEVMPDMRTGLGTKVAQLDDAASAGTDILKRTPRGASATFIGTVTDLGKRIFGATEEDIFEFVDKLTTQRYKSLEKAQKNPGLTSTSTSQYDNAQYVNPEEMTGPDSAPGDIDIPSEDTSLQNNRYYQEYQNMKTEKEAPKPKTKKPVSKRRKAAKTIVKSGVTMQPDTGDEPSIL